MKPLTFVPLVSLLGGIVCAQKTLVTPKALTNDVDIDELLKGAQKLQQFADTLTPHDRVFGGPAHNATITYLYNQLKATGAYDVYLERQRHLWSDSNQTLTVAGKKYAVNGATFGVSGDVTAGLVKVNKLGCQAKNFPVAVGKKIALIERGNCTFSDKVALAGAAGAAGAIIYNNEAGPIAGTLGMPKNPLGPYVPVVFVRQAQGLDFVNRLAKGDTLRSKLYVNVLEERRLTYNVIAETKGGNHSKVVALGAHTDSVNRGPGINDNGSGSIGILHVAKALAKYRVKNAVRFCFWTAEEFGLLGSNYYVEHLKPAQLKKIALYLNFDMIASPNYVYSIYDGDGSKFGTSGPPGSAQIEALFEKFFEENDSPHIPTAFDGRSDYGAFIENGIPAGGLFTGAEEIKTKRQASLFGGTAGVALDACYHAPCDNIDNLALDAFELNTKAIAHSVATYARDLSTIPARNSNAKTSNGVSANKKKEEEDGIRMGCSKHARRSSS